MATTRKKVTLRTLRDLKEQNIPVSFCTAYDYPSAHFCEEAGIDMILVGDSGGMCMLGYKNTMPVTMEEMLHFTRAVCRATKTCFVVGDMPFMSYQVSTQEAVRNAGEFMRAGCDAIKLEGGAVFHETINAIHRAGIPVMVHLGLTPQSLSMQGGYRVHGKTLDEVRNLRTDISVAEDHGASFVLLEGMPEDSAAIVRDAVKIPVYGIGAGGKLDGQLLILHDLIGSFVGDVKPRFAKQYCNVGQMIKQALAHYHDEVTTGKFPNSDYNYPIDIESLTQIREHFIEP